MRVLEEVLSPPWSSEWLSAQGAQKLRAFGIAPPEAPVGNPRHLWQAPRGRAARAAAAATASA